MGTSGDCYVPDLITFQLLSIIDEEVKESKIAPFADDAWAFGAVRDEDSMEDLQDEPENTYLWQIKNNMMLNL